MSHLRFIQQWRIFKKSCRFMSKQLCFTTPLPRFLLRWNIWHYCTCPENHQEMAQKHKIRADSVKGDTPVMKHSGPQMVWTQTSTCRHTEWERQQPPPFNCTQSSETGTLWAPGCGQVLNACINSFYTFNDVHNLYLCASRCGVRREAVVNESPEMLGSRITARLPAWNWPYGM